MRAVAQLSGRSPGSVTDSVVIRREAGGTLGFVPCDELEGAQREFGAARDGCAREDEGDHHDEKEAKASHGRWVRRRAAREAAGD